MSTIYAPPADLWTRNVLPRIEVTPGPLDTPCWVFPGCVNSRGYGCVGAGRRDSTVLVHRLAVLVRDGVMPPETVDHRCFVKRCCNPDHLDPVSQAENNRRYRESRGYRIGGQCGRGHALSGLNLYRHPRGQLVCRECAREGQRRRRAA